MKQIFKPLGIAVAVAAASAGYANMASAQVAVSSNDLGDLALVPYYTVNGEWITGIHIVNTSDKTQVVKFRFRRATDSMDALDFNIVMSPQDVYAGFLSDDADGTISWAADDTTCTVPGTTGGRLEMPDIYRVGAESGYVEIIAMAQTTDESQPIAIAAKHANDVPVNCTAVRSNFFADGVSGTTPGVIDATSTWQASYVVGTTTRPAAVNTYEASDDALKVSYFIRDNDSGVEFGDNAVHISGFLDDPSMTNQQFGYFSGDLTGFDFPDLNGGVPLAGGAPRGRFDLLRAGDVLGVTSIINEWSANPANGVEMDWVVTLPGQYTLFNLPQYVDSLPMGGGWVPTLGNSGAPVTNRGCPRVALAATATSPASPECDYRDMPVVLEFAAYNREEFAGTDPEGELVVSPAPPGEIETAFLPKEANVITFGGNSVLGVSDANVNASLRQPFGWVEASVSSVDTDVQVCDWNLDEDNGAGFPSADAGSALTKTCAAVTNTGVPVIGFAAWQRSVAANPDASYGRIIEHSFMTSTPTP